MDLRYFEIHDLLCDALIALEAGDPGTATAKVRKALAWAEAEWLATPSAHRAAAAASTAPDLDAAGEDD